MGDKYQEDDQKNRTADPAGRRELREELGTHPVRDPAENGEYHQVNYQVD